MNRTKLVAAFALSLVAAAPAAFADNGKPKADPAAAIDRWFVQYDKDADGKLTRQEFRLGRNYFNALDLDTDGILTREEAKKAIAMQPVEVDIVALDTDHDGYVTRREWTGDQAGFDALDLDNDGVISKLDRALERDQARAKSRLRSLDKSKDGAVQRDEWPSNDESFRKQDLNRNGTLSLDELGDLNRQK